MDFIPRVEAYRRAVALATGMLHSTRRDYEILLSTSCYRADPEVRVCRVHVDVSDRRVHGVVRGQAMSDW